MTVEEQLLKIHKQCCVAMHPVTDMVVKRKVSKSTLEKVAKDLLYCSEDVKRFITTL